MSRFGGLRGFGRGWPKEERTRENGSFGSSSAGRPSGSSSALFVPSQDCGKIIGKAVFFCFILFTQRSIDNKVYAKVKIVADLA